ncbi:MAG: hypothetical protein A2Y33_05135 [Spirochaetes bacterium GWF1_51_8]|nr:MAG: hypothetical protein A2Y33_05135 [Spirochaetes bacterium GWF1_51_8]
MKRGVFITGILLMLMSCSTRDFLSNDVLKSQFEAPSINTFSPNQGSSYNGWVAINLSASCPSGLKSIRLNYDGVDITFNNPYPSPEYSIQTNIFFLSSGWKFLRIYAYGKNQTVTYREVSFDVTVPTPSVSINDPSQYQTLTTQMNVLFSGTAWIGEGTVANVFSVTYPQGTNIVLTNNATGTNNWTVYPSLIKNKNNQVKIYAVSDKGVVSWGEERWVTVDQQRPTISLLYPSNNAIVPSTINGIIAANDALSYIPDFFVYYAIDMLGYNSASKSGVNWVFNSPGNSPAPHQISVFAFDAVGNSSLTQTIEVTVAPDMPLISMSNWLLWAVNTPTAVVYGSASVDPGYQVTGVSIKVNNGAWIPVDTFTPGQVCAWSNVSTPLVMNSTNTIVARAMSSSGKVNYTLEHKVIADNIPPIMMSINITNKQKALNTDSIYQNFQANDELSGMGFVSNTMRAYLVAEQFSSYSDMFNKSIWRDISFSIPGGGVVTNILFARDMAGNKTIKTNLIYVYPAIFVSTTGLDSNPGYLYQPVASIQKAVDIAASLGVGAVRVGEGLYTHHSTLACVVMKQGVNISGGYSFDFTTWNPQAFFATIDAQGAAKHVVVAENIYGGWLKSLILKGANSLNAGATMTGFGGGLYAVNSSISFEDCRISANSADIGGAVYASNSYVNFSWTLIEQNTSKAAPLGKYVNSSAHFYYSAMYNNQMNVLPGLNIYPFFIAENSYINMENSSNYNNSIGNTVTGSFIYALSIFNGGTGVILKNNYLQAHNSFSIGLTNTMIGLYFEAPPGYLWIEMNNFVLTRISPIARKVIAIWENQDITGHGLLNNSFISGGIDVWYRDFINGNLTNINDLNSGMKTGAYNYGGNWIY